MQPETKLLKPDVRIFAYAKNAFFAVDQLRSPSPRKPPPLVPITKRPILDKDIAATRLLNPLTVHETQNYLECELQDKGWKNDPEFDAPVFQLIHQFSEGVPKRINTICNYLLLQCFVEQHHRITLADARSIVEDLQLETSITRKPHSEELLVFLTPLEAPLEAEVAAEPAYKQCKAVELPKQESLQRSDTFVSQRQKAHFESRNVSLTRYRARRGKW